MTRDPRLSSRTIKADPKFHHTPQRWADQLVAEVDADVLGQAASDIKRAAVERFDLKLRPVATLGERRGEDGWCDGMSFTDEGVVLYAPTPHSQRENFTIAHELGHLLFDRYERDDLWDWLADHPGRDQFIEETCDAIASRLLLPRDTLSAVIGALRPSATALTEILHRSEASREVCAVAVAERIGCDGFVVLAKADTMSLTFSSRFGATRPRPWRGDPIPEGHTLRYLQPGATHKGESWWPGRSGSRRHLYHHAHRDHDGWIYAVLAENDLWEAVAFHVPPGRDGPVKTFDVNCPCGYRGATTTFPCPECRKPPCPKCGCECDRKAKLPNGVCRTCFMTVSAHLLVEGECKTCRGDD